MNIRALILLIFAGITVLGVITFTRNYLANFEQQQKSKANTTAPAQAPQIQILVAGREMPVGTIVTLEHLRAQAWPKNGLNANYVRGTDKREDLVGKVVRKAMASGEPITKTSLVAQGERGFMAAILTPGMRASTINLNPVAGVGGFIFPGDRVDVILTQSVQQNDMDRTFSETVMQNVRVLAVDQTTEQSDKGARISRTATLEVTRKMAEKVAMLERLGTLSLSLRSLAQNEGQNIGADPVAFSTSATADFEVTRYRQKPDAETNRKEVIVRRGSAINATRIKENIDEPAVAASRTNNTGGSR